MDNLDFDRLSIQPRANEEELERFRREWQDDLKRKEQVSPKATFASLANKPSNIVDPQQHALQLYTEAVEHEQAGKLNEALILYRKAFKFDGTFIHGTADPDNVDRLYARKAPPVAAPTIQPEYTFQRTIQTLPDYTPTGQSSLSVLLAERSDLAFIPFEDRPIPIASLPLELLEPILYRLDVRSIERFAQTCWQARALTAKSLVWRRIVQRIYSAFMPGWGQLADRHAGEWRTALIEEPRLRFDGCYISVCHYIRPGAGDEWVAITHMSKYGAGPS
jgi:F-box protein 9